MVRHLSGSHRGRLWFNLAAGTGAVVAVGVAVSIMMSQVSSDTACAAVTSDVATHYVPTGAGNCDYPSAPASGLFVALSPAEYDGSAACGEYLKVSGPDGSVTAEVIDQCPPCQTGHIDLSETAFEQLAPLAAGEVDVTYQALTNPPLPGPLEVAVKSGSSAYWLALQVINTGNQVASVSVGGHALTRASYNYWIASSGDGTGPFSVQVTDTRGHQVTLTGIQLSPGAVQDTAVWMYTAARTMRKTAHTARRTVHPRLTPSAIMPFPVQQAAGMPAARPSATATCQ
jgi:expansin (peptidoglycan-binding protein)